MTIIFAIIQILALVGAFSILFYDKRSSRHCQSASVFAYLLFVLFGFLFLAAFTQSVLLILTIMTAIISINVGNLVISKGNVKTMGTKITPHTDYAKFKRPVKKPSEGKRHA